MPDREKWVDGIKGIAITLVVVHHVFDGLYSSGICTNEILEVGVKCFQMFHMPLFMMVSGYLYALSYVKDNKVLLNKTLRQLINLSVIYVMYSILRFSVRKLFPTMTNHALKPDKIIGILIYSIDELWYLYSLIVIYVVISIIFLLDVKKLFFLLVLVGTVYSVFFLRSGPTILRTIQYCPYFILGMYYEFGLQSIKNRFKPTILVIEICVSIFAMIFKIGILESGWKANLISVIVSYLMCDALFGICYYLYGSKSFCKIGDYFKNLFCVFGENSLVIYLFHIYCTAGLRPVIRMTGMNSLLAIVLLIIAGLIVPLLIKRVSVILKIDKLLFKPTVLCKMACEK